MKTTIYTQITRDIGTTPWQSKSSVLCLLKSVFFSDKQGIEKNCKGKFGILNIKTKWDMTCRIITYCIYSLSQ